MIACPMLVLELNIIIALKIKFIIKIYTRVL